MAPTTKKAAVRPTIATGELIPSDSGVETWRNTSPGTVYINRVGEYGRRVTELVNGGRLFTITPTERRMNQNACATPELDMFTNGTCQPVSLLDDEPDTERLRNNPNALDDKDLIRLFRLKGEAFRERLAQITNVAAMSRLIEVARSPQHDVTLQQYEMVKARKIELEGEADRVAPEPADPNTAGLPKAVTPR